MMDSIASVLTRAPVIPVLTIAGIDNAVPLARALCKGGLTVLEVTLRTDTALEAITTIAREVPDAVVGAGTVLAPSDIYRAREAGARFAVSPGLTDSLARATALPLLPGVATASEIMRGKEWGFTHFKFFPAESSGGVAALKSFAGPFANIRFCPTGGITAQTAPDYLALPNVLCVGGSWMVPQAMIDGHDWNGITALAQQAAALRPPRQ
ncbi:MAG TPA: bifunctional 4-hydroxy-2-oxoglutarate aldolase/2-dehydro-3-deoxy-phosphogluconate aldolase [Rhizomicrobium sp.]|nr:bifunctional 4-hydroxy-2-oxoglutarate aldolase/2-dehydro-3-deoxy-phosphogluconate aldolase [Rhizomicrobium sp.]